MGRDEMTRADHARSESLLLDTHTLVWLVFGNRGLGRRAEELIQTASESNRVFVSAVTPWEIGLLASKKRINLHVDTLAWVRVALSKPGIRLAPLEPEIAVGSNQLPFEMHADPADRILVATARHLGATLVTADRALLDLGKEGRFRVLNAAN
jgi:PIN domain nuclease of toxin-antitoxin system